MDAIPDRQVTAQEAFEIINAKNLDLAEKYGPFTRFTQPSSELTPEALAVRNGDERRMKDDWNAFWTELETKLARPEEMTAFIELVYTDMQERCGTVLQRPTKLNWIFP